jgi:hypothetical protein
MHLQRGKKEEEEENEEKERRNLYSNVSPVRWKVSAMHFQDDVAEPSLLPLDLQLIKDSRAVVLLHNGERRWLEQFVRELSGDGRGHGGREAAGSASSPSLPLAAGQLMPRSGRRQSQVVLLL